MSEALSVEATKFSAIRNDNGQPITGFLMWHQQFMELKPYIKEKTKGPLEWIEVIPNTINRKL